MLGKYKYYFRKPKSEIVKDIFTLLVVSGAICVAASSPYFVRNLLKNFKKWKKYSKKKINDSFSNLKRQGFIKIRKENHQIYIELTEKGRYKAGMYQINDLKIKRPKKWDKKWRIIIFDISELKKLHRAAFRGKLKEIGFYPLQKSVWVYPYDCRSEVELLKDFFGLKEKEVRLIVAEDIGQERELKKIFDLT